MSYPTPNIDEKNSVSEILLDMIRLAVAGISGGGSTSKGATSTVAEVSLISGNVATAFALNATRVSAIVYNVGAGKVYVKYGTGCSNASFTYCIEVGETVIIDDYTGAITVYSVGDATILTTEINP